MVSHQTAGDEDANASAQREGSPPYYTTFEARGIHPPTFSNLKPRDYRIPAGKFGFTTVAWSCDGRRLAAVGIDKLVRVWNPDKSIEPRSATIYAGGHGDDIDHIAWNPTHPDLFCTVSSRDRRIVFWDARQTRYIQSLSTSPNVPLYVAYSPTGRDILWISTSNGLMFAKLGKENEESTRETWMHNTLYDPSPHHTSPVYKHSSIACWDNSGQNIIVSHGTNPHIKLSKFPSLKEFRQCPAHVNGVNAMAYDPTGRYFASGGGDSIVNLFDTTDWLCAKTITSSEYNITSLSFSHDGEYIAIANQGNYIDICGVETGALLHRVPTPASAPVVAWHPSRYVIAYCGTISKPKPEAGPGGDRERERDRGRASQSENVTTTISLFGLLN